MHPRLKFLHNDIDIDAGGIDDVVNSFKAALQKGVQFLPGFDIRSFGEYRRLFPGKCSLRWRTVVCGYKFILEHVH